MIKQSLPVFLSIVIGIIMVVVPFNLFKDNIILITSLITIFNIILVFILQLYGDRKLKRL